MLGVAQMFGSFAGVYPTVERPNPRRLAYFLRGGAWWWWVGGGPGDTESPPPFAPGRKMPNARVQEQNPETIADLEKAICAAWHPVDMEEV